MSTETTAALVIVILALGALLAAMTLGMAIASRLVLL
jgi:hypothetical protein